MDLNVRALRTVHTASSKSGPLNKLKPRRTGGLKPLDLPTPLVGGEEYPTDPLPQRWHGERKFSMATMAIPFEAVEQNMMFVCSGVSISERMHAIRRVFSQAFLTVAFHDAANEQGKLIAMLDDGWVNHLTAEQLLDTANRLDSLVDKTHQMVTTANRVNFSLWNGSLSKIAEQCERLDSLAESYRLSASEGFTAYVDELVEHKEVGAEECWRDFVATLHD